MTLENANPRQTTTTPPRRDKSCTTGWPSRDEPQHHQHTQGVRAPHYRVVTLSQCHGQPTYRNRTERVSNYQRKFIYVEPYIVYGRIVQIFFCEERMHIGEGWTRPTTSITRATLNALGAVTAANANWTATQECEPLVLGPDTTI
jgi:hypothetical protein